MRARSILLAAAAAFVLAAFAAARNRIDTELTALLPRDAPAARALARYARTFGGQDLLVVLVEGDAPADVAAAADHLAAELGRDPDVRTARAGVRADVTGALRAHLLALIDEADWREVERRARDPRTARRLRAILNAPVGGAGAELARADPLGLYQLALLRMTARVRIQGTSGRFESADGKMALVLVEPAHPVSDTDADERLLATVRRAGARLGRVRVSATGAPAYRLAYERAIRRDLTLSSMASMAAILALFGLFFRSLRILPLVAIALGLAYVLTLGLWGLVSGRIGGIALAFGGILLGIGVDVPIQLWSRIREERLHAEPAQAVRRAVRALGGVSIVATLGPAAVFAACGLSRFPGLRELGGLAALGLCLNLGVMLLVLPALLEVAGPLWGRLPRAARGEAWLERLGAACARRHRAVLITASVVVALCGWLGHVRFAPHPLAFEASFEPTQIEDRIERQFGARRGRLIALCEADSLEGALALEDRVVAAVRQVGSGAVETLADLLPSRATQQARLERARAAWPALAAAFAAELRAAGLREGAFSLDAYGGAAAAPASLEELERAGLGFLLPFYVRQGGGRVAVASYVAPRTAADVPALADAIARAGGVATGAPLVDREIAAALPGDLLRVTAASIAAVALLLVAYYRRLRPVAYVLLPLAAAWIVFAAVAPALSVWNLIALPLVIGYGIDDHVFLVGRVLEGGADAGRALRLTGRAVALTSVATLAGFGSLELASFAGIRSLGAAGGLAVALCFAAAMILLPALVGVRRGGRVSVSDKTRDQDHDVVS